MEVELNEVMRKYKAAVAQLSVDQITLQDQAAQLLTLEHEKSSLKEQVCVGAYIIILVLCAMPCFDHLSTLFTYSPLSDRWPN